MDIERKNRTREPVQCYRCQGFRHSKNSCMRPPRCMKCAGGHLSSCCTKPRTTPATCANCSGEHISAYKGCPSYKTEKRKLAVNNIDISKIRTIKDANITNYGRQGPPSRNNFPRLPFSSSTSNRTTAESRQDTARARRNNPFRQNGNEARLIQPRFSSHDFAIQKRLNKWRRNTDNVSKKGTINPKDKPKPRTPNMTSNPAQKHLEMFQEKLRKARCERKEQDPEENKTNIRMRDDESPPTTSRAARAFFKPRIIDDNIPTPMDTYSNPQKSPSDYYSKSLTQRVENIEKKIDNLMEMLFKCLESTKESTLAHLMTS